jgi:YaiO family outer membrane protein
MLHRFADRTILIGKVIEAERFDVRDRMVSLAGYYPIAASTTAFAEIAASDPHRALPRDRVHVQLAQSFALGWGATVGWKHIRYDTTDVDLGDLTLEKYFSDYRAAFTYFPSHSSSAGSATSTRFQIGYHPGAGTALRLSLAKGIEVERPSAFNPVLATPVKSAGLDGRHPLSRDFSLTWALGRTLQETLTRNLAGLGLLYRF